MHKYKICRNELYSMDLLKTVGAKSTGLLTILKFDTIFSVSIFKPGHNIYTLNSHIRFGGAIVG